MTIIIKNVKKEFLPATKAFAKAINAKCKVKKKHYTLKDIDNMREFKDNPLSKKEKEALKKEVYEEIEKTILKDVQDLENKRKKGTLKTFSSAREMHKDIFNK